MKRLSNNLRTPLWVALAALVLLLAACGTTLNPEATAGDRFDLITSVTIDESVSRAELEAYSGGSVISYHPEAGFAVVAFQKGQGDLALMDTADPNQDMLETPEVEAGGWTAWSGGWTAWSGGWTAWSGGWTAWSGGWTAWSGGWTAWSGGVDASSTFGENLFAWNDVKLPQGQLMAPNLGSGVKIAVIDTGVSLNHPALSGNLAPSYEWMDYVDNDTYPMDEAGGGSTGHGTAVAGIILQVAPQATILPIRVLAADGSGDVDHVVAGIDHAVAMGADVINLSLGTDTDVTALQAMVDYATSLEIFVISSLGNAGNSDVTFPARYAKNSGNTGHYLISVGSVGKGKKKSGFSNFGASAELFAPGEAIYSVARNDNDESLVNHTTGTSFAAPMVSGTIALALGESPTSSQRASIPTMLLQTADDLEASNPEYTGQLGNGQLNVEGFLGNLGYGSPSPERAALLVANLSPSSSTVFIEDRLELLGFSVTLMDDDAVSASDANGKDLVVVSHTVSSGDINGMFRDVAVPVITWEDGIFEDMGLASSRGDVDGVTDLTIATSHPLSAGFSGDIEVYQELDRLAWGTPGSGAITVATVPGQPGKAVIFAYEEGAQMVGLTAPAKRVGFFYQNYDADHYGYRGVTLFDAAVMWATVDTPVPPLGNSAYFEAEAPSGIEGSFTTEADSSVSGGSYMSIPQGVGGNYDGTNTQAWLHFDFNADTAGTYYLWLRVFGADTGSDSFYVQLDNGSNDALHFESQNTWLWKKVSGSYYLDGNHTLTISHREDGARLDRILITSDASFVPSGLGGN